MSHPSGPSSLCKAMAGEHRCGGSCYGCNSISQKIFARASSSESLEGGPMARVKAWKKNGRDNGSALKKRNSRSDLPPIKKAEESSHAKLPRPGLGTLSGVLIPTCENMWGVLIFLRFYYIVGNAGVWQSAIVVCLSFLCAILTTMSLSAVATNGPIEEGGTYYLISRALGPKLGGTVGILYYMGVALLAVLESLGAVEMLLFTFPELEFTSANRVIGAFILVILCCLVFFGISFVSKLSLVFFAVVIYAMCSYYLGLFLAPRGHAPSNLTGLKWSTFKGNWNSGYDSGVSFPGALAIFFPCYTGILSGADRAKNLAQPEKSIPRGTLGAITISSVMYLSYMGLWAAVGSRDYLLGRSEDGSPRSGHGGGQNLEVVKDVAFPLAILTQLGIIIASMAQAFQCLITSPRLLQAIASDGVIPPLRRLSKLSANGEPRAALVVTMGICVLAAMIGSLDAVAPLVSICFLTAYSALNFSCFVLSILKAPSWRPKWKFYHWSAALVGFVLCFVVNFVIRYYWAIAAVVVQVLIYIYIDYRQVEVDWGTGLGGLRLHLAVRSILSVGHEARYSVNWRPQLLCLCKPRSAAFPEEQNNDQFLSLVSQLKKGRGLCVVATILEGNLERMAPQIEAETLELENSMQSANVTGFARILVAPTYKEGKTYAIQSSGLGALEPNTLLLGWPDRWHDEGYYHNAQVMLEILDECKAVDKAVVLCMNVDEFPTKENQQEGYIDVWWIVHDGGLLLILTHLLQQHRTWRKCKLRVFTVSEEEDDREMVQSHLNHLLDKIRIEAEVHVIDVDSDGLAPYTYDNTIRLEEARSFAEEVAQYRLHHKHPELTKQTSMQRADLNKQTSMQRAELNKQASMKSLRKDNQEVSAESELVKSPTARRSSMEDASRDRPTLDDIFKETPANPTPPHSPHDGGLNVSRSFADQERISPNDNQSHRVDIELGTFGGSTHEHQSKPDFGRHDSKAHSRSEQASKHQSVHKAAQILKSTVPTELSILTGTHHHPRPRSGPLHALKSKVAKLTKDSASKENVAESSEGGVSAPNAFQQAAASMEPSVHPDISRPISSVEEEISTRDESDRSVAPEPSFAPGNLRQVKTGRDDHDSQANKAPPSQQKGNKETRWADDSKGPEIRADTNEEAGKDALAEQFHRPIFRTGSAGQLYPGSPHNSDYGTNVDIPDVVNRTWETFSQNYSSSKLNQTIWEYSKDAQLVLLNLPDHYRGMEPTQYMEYCEEITKGLRRVLLVNGTGRELWNAL